MVTTTIDELMAAWRDDLIATRRDLHAHPELGFQEYRTARLVAERLSSLGLVVRTGVGHTGVVAHIEGAGPGRTLMLRADMDALPIQELNEVPYASTTPGVMHACGHDAHVSILLAVARALSGWRENWAGMVKLVFQPAEEGAGGAQAMIEDGVLEDVPPDAVLGLHLSNSDEHGLVMVSAGAIQASSDSFTATIVGRGGHGAIPHRTIDPVPVAAEAVLALQRIASREVAPLEPVVLSIGSIHGGTAPNIIPGEVTLSGTVRTFNAELRTSIPERIDRILNGVTAAAGAGYRLEYRHGTPPVVNDTALADLVRSAASAVVGVDRVRESGRVMPSDDMARFLERVPGCYFFLGSGNSARGLTYPHHHARFDFEEECLVTGARVLAGAALRYLAASSG